MGRGRAIALSLAGVVALAVGVVYGGSEIRLARHFAAPHEALRAATDSARLARGRHLAAVSCTGCHGADLGGRIMIDAMPFMRLYAPNLTSGPNGAAATLSDAQMEAVLRHAVLPDGRSALIMPGDVFTSFADDDVVDILGAIRTAPPVDHSWPSPAVGPVGRALIAVGVVHLQTAERVDPLASHTATAPTLASPVEYGRYSAIIDGCVRCHGDGLSGGPIPDMGPKKGPASNITPTGLSLYTEADFARALREGRRPGGATIDTLMPWKEFHALSDSEVGALWAYLRTVPPKPYGGR